MTPLLAQDHPLKQLLHAQGSCKIKEKHYPSTPVIAKFLVFAGAYMQLTL